MPGILGRPAYIVKHDCCNERCLGHTHAMAQPAITQFAKTRGRPTPRTSVFCDIYHSVSSFGEAEGGVKPLSLAYGRKLAKHNILFAKDISPRYKQRSSREQGILLKGTILRYLLRNMTHIVDILLADAT